MITKQDHLNLIKRYVLAYDNDVKSGFSFEKNQTRTELSHELYKEIKQIFEIQAKLIDRLNSYHSDTLMLQEAPEAVFEWDHQLTLDMNNEVYKLLGIEANENDF